MKKILTITFIIAIHQILMAQSTINTTQYTSITDSIFTSLNEYISQTNRYEIYTLDNTPIMFLRLDTQTGKIEKIRNKTKQIDIVNNQDLSIKSKRSLFKLYPTNDSKIFILLDKATGRTWNILWDANNPNQRIQKIQ